MGFVFELVHTTQARRTGDIYPVMRFTVVSNRNADLDWIGRFLVRARVIQHNFHNTAPKLDVSLQISACFSQNCAVRVFLVLITVLPCLSFVLCVGL